MLDGQRVGADAARPRGQRNSPRGEAWSGGWHYVHVCTDGAVLNLMVMALRFPLGLLQLPRCACIEAIATTVATLTLAANATHAPTAVAIIAATTRATATTRNRVQPPALLLQNYCIYGRGAGYRNDTFRTLDATPSAILMHFHSTCRTHREHVGSTRSTHAWPSVCVCVLLGTCITHREPLEKVHMQKRQPCKKTIGCLLWVSRPTPTHANACNKAVAPFLCQPAAAGAPRSASSAAAGYTNSTPGSPPFQRKRGLRQVMGDCGVGAWLSA